MSRSSKPSRWSTTESRQSRGYGADWDAKRLRILQRDNWLCQCEECKASGRLREIRQGRDAGANQAQVDHVVSRAKAKAMGWSAERIESDDNLQAIARECHDRKTQREVGATPKPKRLIGLDGFPVEGHDSA